MKLRTNNCLLLFCFLLTSFSTWAQDISTDLTLEQFRLAERNVVLLKNEDQLIPLKRLDSLRIAYLPLGFDTLEIAGRQLVEGQELASRLADYTRLTMLTPPSQDDAGAWIEQQRHHYDLFILGIKNYTQRVQTPLPWKVYGELIEALCTNTNSIAIIVGRRQGEDWPAVQSAQAILTMSHTGLFQQSIAAQIVFGALGAQGQIPVSLPGFPLGSGISTEGGERLAFMPPALAGMDGQLLQDSIRAIIAEGIAAGAFPGAQVLVAKDGRVVYHETFGTHTYEGDRPVEKDDLYDLASITKVTGPLPALMRLHGQGQFDLDAPLRRYLRIRKKSDKALLTFREMLAHQARLRPYIPYWVGTLRSSARYPWEEGWNARAVNDWNFRGRTFKRDSSRRYNIRITDGLWLHRNYKKQMYRAIDRSPLLEETRYVYSGLLFFLLPEMISDLAGMDYERYLKNRFYHRLGAYTLTYNPMRLFPKDKIVPTERDSFFRFQQVQGTVHDEGAAMLGGISGNAGLFATTLDLAKLMQMYLNLGEYGGERYIAESSVREFTRCQYCATGNRRGLGFDKPPVEYEEGESYVARSASPASFGHSGFTGTFTWADPEHGLLLVFMSNRVYPTRDRRGLYELQIRPRIHQVLYEAVVETGRLRDGRD